MEMDNLDLLINFGGAIKALERKGDLVTLGAHGIRWGDESKTDLVGDWFDKSTNLGARAGLGVDTMLNHGIPLSVKLVDFAPLLLPATVKAEVDDLGLLVATVYDLRDAYQRKMIEMCEEGLLSWSSGANHRAVRRANNATAGKIVQWPVMEFSMTPTPCEPRMASILPLKSLTGPDFETERYAKAIRVLTDLAPVDATLTVIAEKTLWTSESAAENEKSVTGSTSLPIAPRDTTWDAEKANARVREFTKSTDKPSAAYKKAFFYVTDGESDNFTSYKLPFADVIDDKLTAIPKAIFAAAGALDGARGGKVDIPTEQVDGIKKKITGYYKKMAKEFEDDALIPPWDSAKSILGDWVENSLSLAIYDSLSDSLRWLILRVTASDDADEQVVDADGEPVVSEELTYQAALTDEQRIAAVESGFDDFKRIYMMIYRAVLAGDAEEDRQEATKTLKTLWGDPQSEGALANLHVGSRYEAHSAKVLAAVGELHERTKALIDLRCVKSGRVLSQENYERLQSHAEALGAIHADLNAMLDEHKPGKMDGISKHIDIEQELTRMEMIRGAAQLAMASN